jgi:hypothetical protein
MRHPNSGLPEFGNIIVQVGNSRLGCAGPESILPAVVMDSGLARSLSSGAHPRDPVARPGMTGESRSWADLARMTLKRKAFVSP